MSSTLVWEVITRKENTLCTATKFLLQELADGRTVDMFMSDLDIPVLKGLRVGRHEDVKSDIDELIEAIEAHGQIKVSEVF